MNTLAKDRLSDNDQIVQTHINDVLDAALEMTFPANDPVAVYIPETDRDALTLGAISTLKR